MRVQLTVRVEPHTAGYIADVAHAASRATGIRMSIGQAAATLLERAESEGWIIEAPRPQASRPDAPAPPEHGPGPAQPTGRAPSHDARPEPI